MERNCRRQFWRQFVFRCVATLSRSWYNFTLPKFHQCRPLALIVRSCMHRVHECVYEHVHDIQRTTTVSHSRQSVRQPTSEPDRKWRAWSFEQTEKQSVSGCSSSIEWGQYRQCSEMMNCFDCTYKNILCYSYLFIIFLADALCCACSSNTSIQERSQNATKGVGVLKSARHF